MTEMLENPSLTLFSDACQIEERGVFNCKLTSSLFIIIIIIIIIIIT